MSANAVTPQTHYSSCSPYAFADAGTQGAYGHARSCVSYASAVAYANPGEFNSRGWADEPEHYITVSALFTDPGGKLGRSPRDRFVQRLLSMLLMHLPPGWRLGWRFWPGSRLPSPRPTR